MRVARRLMPPTVCVIAGGRGREVEDRVVPLEVRVDVVGLQQDDLERRAPCRRRRAAGCSSRRRSRRPASPCHHRRHRCLHHRRDRTAHRSLLVVTPQGEESQHSRSMEIGKRGSHQPRRARSSSAELRRHDRVLGDVGVIGAGVLVGGLRRDPVEERDPRVAGGGARLHRGADVAVDGRRFGQAGERADRAQDERARVARADGLDQRPIDRRERAGPGRPCRCRGRWCRG